MMLAAFAILRAIPGQPCLLAILLRTCRPHNRPSGGVGTHRADLCLPAKRRSLLAAWPLRRLPMVRANTRRPSSSTPTPRGSLPGTLADKVEPGRLVARANSDGRLLDANQYDDTLCRSQSADGRGTKRPVCTTDRACSRRRGRSAGRQHGTGTLIGRARGTRQPSPMDAVRTPARGGAFRGRRARRVDLSTARLPARACSAAGPTPKCTSMCRQRSRYYVASAASQ
jgi:hypothetical protein